MREADEREFRFRVYTPRWGHHDNYKLKVIDDGWYVSHIAINGECDRQGNPYLFDNLRQDSIEFPDGLGFEMELLFEHARDRTIPDEEIQARLNRLARWVEEVNGVERPVFD